jgi:hypothetical protein
MPTKSTAKKAAKPVRKSAVKKAVRKTPAKRASKAAAKALICAEGTQCFWARDGQILQNLTDLHVAFGNMDDEIFLYHANEGKNDFADWVETVLEDRECAEALRKSAKKREAQKALADCLKSYGIK